MTINQRSKRRTPTRPIDNEKKCKNKFKILVVLFDRIFSKYLEILLWCDTSISECKQTQFHKIAVLFLLLLRFVYVYSIRIFCVVPGISIRHPEMPPSLCRDETTKYDTRIVWLPCK